MSQVYRINLHQPTLLEFRGPDTVRYLNGQLTQDVRLVAGNSQTLPACVTDAKGKLQYRVWVREGTEAAIVIDGPPDNAEALEARLTRYLIADDVEVADASGQWSLMHFTGPVGEAPDGVIVKESSRYGLPGTDWWIPAGATIEFPADVPLLEGDALEAYRIGHRVPAWGAELTEGILPPEAGLDATDISYAKGCYIGQEVISRIKSAGKVNKTLRQISFDSSLPREGLELVGEGGKPAGEVTSISPIADGDQRLALAYIKRTAEGVQLLSSGDRHAVSIL